MNIEDITVGSNVRLKPEHRRQQGKASSDKGIVCKIDNTNILVQREGLQLPTWYTLAANIWELESTAVSRDQLLEHIKKDLTDTTAQLVYSDWLEERGDLFTSTAWRWMAKSNKRPEYRQGPHLLKRWRWWGVDSQLEYQPNIGYQPKPTPINSTLPFPLFAACFGSLRYSVLFHDLHQAVHALAKGINNIKTILYLNE